MADETATNDTSVSEDTSTNDEALDTDDFELEDIEVSPEDMKLDDTDEQEETEEDTAATESDEESEESEDDDESQDSTEESSEDNTQTEQERQNAARIAFQEREAKRRAEKAQSQAEYLDGAEDDRDLALRQLQIDAYNNRIESNTNKLQGGLNDAVRDIDLFKTGTPEQKAKLYEELDKFEALYVKKDQNGDPIEVSGDVYQYLVKEAETIKRLAGIGARQQKTDKANQKARTLTPPAKTPKAPAKDPMLEAFDEEAGI